MQSAAQMLQMLPLLLPRKQLLLRIPCWFWCTFLGDLSWDILLFFMHQSEEHQFRFLQFINVFKYVRSLKVFMIGILWHYDFSDKILIFSHQRTTEMRNSGTFMWSNQSKMLADKRQKVDLEINMQNMKPIIIQLTSCNPLQIKAHV